MPEPSAFTFTRDGTKVTVTQVVRTAARSITLTLQEGVGAGTPVTLSYTAPAADNSSATNPAIQATTGQDSQSFTNVTVTNAASTVPNLSSATIPAAGNTIALVFSQSLLTTGNGAPLASAFKVTRNGEPVAVSTIGISGTTVTLNLPVQLYREVIKVSYTPPTPYTTGTGNVALQRVTSGEDVLPFTDVSVTNNAVLTTPVVQAVGNTVVLTYTMNLAETMPAPTAFTFTRDGTGVPVTSVARTTEKTITLTLAEGVGANTPVTLSYSAPEANNSSATNPAIQGTTGEDFQSFTDVTVTNTASNVPNLTTATIPAAGNTITLTFSKTLLATAGVKPSASAFTVTYGGMAQRVTGTAVSGTTLILTLYGTVAKDLPVGVS
jgi:uncharacterized repeat protein (TIGR02059 family)